jgi:hypothetical protein
MASIRDLPQRRPALPTNGVQTYGENDCSVELLARRHMCRRSYGVEGWERVRVVAGAAANTSRHLILVVLQRQSHVLCYEYCFGMSCLAQVV